MKQVTTKDLMSNAAIEIEKIAPKNSHFEIDIKEDPIGVYQTHMKLITKYKTFFTKKEDAFLYKSFSKALRALKVQINKKRSIRSSVHLNYQ